MMLLVGFGEGNWGGIGPMINELFPTSIRAAVLGIIYNLSRGAQFVAPVMIAFLLLSQLPDQGTYVRDILPAFIVLPLGAGLALKSTASHWTERSPGQLAVTVICAPVSFPCASTSRAWRASTSAPLGKGIAAETG